MGDSKGLLHTYFNDKSKTFFVDFKKKQDVFLTDLNLCMGEDII